MEGMNVGKYMDIADISKVGKFYYNSLHIVKPVVDL